MDEHLKEENDKLIQRLRKTLCLSNKVDITFRDSRDNGFGFTIAGTPKQIEETETHIKSFKFPFLFIEGKSDVDEYDKDFQCLYCNFRHS